jgi:hypothetical protein
MRIMSPRQRYNRHVYVFTLTGIYIGKGLGLCGHCGTNVYMLHSANGKLLLLTVRCYEWLANQLCVLLSLAKASGWQVLHGANIHFLVPNFVSKVPCFASGLVSLCLLGRQGGRISSLLIFVVARFLCPGQLWQLPNQTTAKNSNIITL